MEVKAETSSTISKAPSDTKISKGRFQLSRLNQRRLANFRANRRGYWSFWIFVVLFVASLFAELIANDRPYFVYLKGEIYLPIMKDYTESDFGGDFELDANYRVPEVVELIESQGGFMVFPPIRFSYDTINHDLKVATPSPPSGENWLGTDDVGRDVVARLIYGFRISVLFGLLLATTSSMIGIMAGAVQGYFGGWTDLLFQRFIEIWGGIPTLYLLIILSSFITPSFWVLAALLIAFGWTALVGLIRAEFLRVRNFEYVRAAEALGVPTFTIMVRHLLPNAMVATLTFMPFILNGSITTLTSLDFLGFGLPTGSPSLGEMLAQGKRNDHAPWLGLSAFFTLSIMLSLLIFVGEAVRDAFDPRKTFKD